MILITAEWQDANSFKLIPIDKECPYSEGIFDIEKKVLALMSWQSKDSMHLVARLNENGDPVPPKKPRPNGKRYQEQRVVVDTFVEYYVSIPEEIENLLNMFAINAKEFDYKQYLTADPKGKLLSTVPASKMPDKTKENIKKEIKKPAAKKA